MQLVVVDAVAHEAAAADGGDGMQRDRTAAGDAPAGHIIGEIGRRKRGDAATDAERAARRAAEAGSRSCRIMVEGAAAQRSDAADDLEGAARTYPRSSDAIIRESVAGDGVERAGDIERDGTAKRARRVR